MRRLLPLLLLTACVTVQEPRARIFDARPLEPEYWYEDLYTSVRRCAEILNHASDITYSDIEWFIVRAGVMGEQGAVSGEGNIAGLSSTPNRIYLDERFVVDQGIITHELGHVGIKAGENQHESATFKLCTGTL